VLLSKNDLLKTLRSLSEFDTNASPFVAVQLVENSLPRFFRSSINGQIMSSDFDLLKTGNTYVSLSHFKDCLKVLPEEKIELSLDPNGILKISSLDNTFDSEIRVHTVPVTQAGLKAHDLGGVATRLGANTFLGCDTSPFAAASPPMLVNGRLFISTKFGAVMWNGPDWLRAVQLQPREPFLKLITGNSAVEDLFLTEKGYWGTAIAGMVIFSYGHLLGRELFDAYAAPGVELTRFPAARLVQALHAAAGLCDDQDKVEIRPKEGIVVRDKFGNDSRFSLGGSDGWQKFTAFGRTMKTIADALSQAADEEAVLLDIPSFTNPTKRLQRGPWSVSFKTL
jgi:hypothetical protein